MNRGREYYRDTDADFHALRRDGQRHQSEATDQWECGACEKQHTARLGTSMYQLKTASERVGVATYLAMKGMSVADISEVMGHSADTIGRWLEWDGAHSEPKLNKTHSCFKVKRSDENQCFIAFFFV